jgi:hypothetical protein
MSTRYLLAQTDRLALGKEVGLLVGCLSWVFKRVDLSRLARQIERQLSPANPT